MLRRHGRRQRLLLRCCWRVELRLGVRRRFTVIVVVVGLLEAQLVVVVGGRRRRRLELRLVVLLYLCPIRFFFGDRFQLRQRRQGGRGLELRLVRRGRRRFLFELRLVALGHGRHLVELRLVVLGRAVVEAPTTR